MSRSPHSRRKEFWGLPLRLSEATLVPRPDTETVVELALEIFRGRRFGAAPAHRRYRRRIGRDPARIAARISDAFAVGTDVSLTALDTARDNAVALGLAGRAASSPAPIWRRCAARLT